MKYLIIIASPSPAHYAIRILIPPKQILCRELMGDMKVPIFRIRSITNSNMKGATAKKIQFIYKKIELYEKYQLWQNNNIILINLILYKLMDATNVNAHRPISLI
jgi:hypothetical protein